MFWQVQGFWDFEVVFYCFDLFGRVAVFLCFFVSFIRRFASTILRFKELLSDAKER